MPLPLKTKAVSVECSIKPLPRGCVLRLGVDSGDESFEAYGSMEEAVAELVGFYAEGKVRVTIEEEPVPA